MRSACAARSRVSVFANPGSAARMNALQLTCLPLPQALTTHQAPEREASCAWYAGTSSGPCPWSGTAVAQGPTKSVRPVRDAGGFPSPGFHHRWPAARDRHRAEAPQLSRPPRSPSGRILPVSRAARGASADSVRSSGVSHSASLAGCRDSHSLRHNLRCGVRPGVSVRGFRTGTSPVQSPSDPVSRFRDHWSHSMRAWQTRCTGG